MKNIFSEKGILSGKRVLALAMVLNLAFGITIGVTASNYTFKSSGNVEYANGSASSSSVVFDKSDLEYLDNQIDNLESNVITAKEGISSSLSGWSLPSDKVLSSSSTFADINSTLEYIKTIPGDGSSYTDDSGNQYYLASDGTVTTDSSAGVAVNITAATADNLSAGARAWVNGQLITGNGSDNKNYYIQNADIAVTLTCSGNLASYDRGYMCSYTSTVTVYIINGIPTSSSIDVTGSSSRLYDGTTGYSSWTNYANYSIKKISIIDKNKNEIKVLYSK